MSAEGQVRCESHHWLSTNVPGLLTRWVIQCSLCGAYNVAEMNAALSAAGFGLVADAGAKALEDAADVVSGATMPFLDLGTCRYVAEHIRILAKDMRTNDAHD